MFNSFGLKYQVKNSDEGASAYFSENFESISGGGRMFGHLKTTIGGDVAIGRKFHFILGIGAYVKVFIKQEGYAKDFKDLTLGLKFNSGFGYRLSDRFLLRVLYQFQLGLTPVFVENRRSPGGAKYTIGENELQLFLQVGIHYLLKSK